MDCRELADPAVHDRRAAAWRAAAEANGGVHPDVTLVESRVLLRMRSTARPALAGGGMSPTGD
jgi:dihydroxy-acid dehydratase